MDDPDQTGADDDPYALGRFVEAQARVYPAALAELQAGLKRTHWMWFVFPQLRGLGHSPHAQRFGIGGLEEARAYLQHPVLGPRLLHCAALVLEADAPSARAVLGAPDDLKLHACATLFSQVSPAGSVFHRLIARYFGARPHRQSLRLLAEGGGGG
jgi:uncharacterized protein (DUF1810 family)